MFEAKTKQNSELWTALQQDFETLEYVDCFNSIGIQYNSFLPVRIKTKPCIAILKKRKQKLNAPKINLEIEKSAETIQAISKEKLADNMIKQEILNEKVISENIVEPPQIVAVDAIPNDEIPLNTIEIEDVDDFDTLKENQVGNAESIENVEENEIDAPQNKEINFAELRNLALNQHNRRSKATKLKIRKIIEQHYRSKGKQIENDSLETTDKEHSKPSQVRKTVKSIIKQERIKEMIEQIATMDLTKMCDLDKISTKDCLKQVIDKIDENEAK